MDPVCGVCGHVAGDPADGRQRIDWLRERLALAEKERDAARRYAAAWKASAKSNRIGFAWWDACADAAWAFSGTLSRVLCERFKIRIYVEPSPDSPHGGGYYTSANDRRDEITAAIDRIEAERDTVSHALAHCKELLRAIEWCMPHPRNGGETIEYDCPCCGFVSPAYRAIGNTQSRHAAECALEKALRGES